MISYPPMVALMKSGILGRNFLLGLPDLQTSDSEVALEQSRPPLARYLSWSERGCQAVSTRNNVKENASHGVVASQSDMLA